MSKRSAVLSRVFFRRPAVKDLVPDLRLLLACIVVGCESYTGVYRPAGLSDESGLDASALSGGLADLESRGHISRDQNTGEVFISSYYRDNVFRGEARARQWRDDFFQIESQTLKSAVLAAVAASPECCLVAKEILKPIVNSELPTKGKVKEMQGKIASLVSEEHQVEARFIDIFEAGARAAGEKWDEGKDHAVINDCRRLYSTLPPALAAEALFDFDVKYPSQALKALQAAVEKMEEKNGEKLRSQLVARSIARVQDQMEAQRLET